MIATKRPHGITPETFWAQVDIPRDCVAEYRRRKELHG